MTEFEQLVELTGLKKSKIAEIAGVTLRTVSRWIKGESEPPKMLVEKLRLLNYHINN